MNMELKETDRKLYEIEQCIASLRKDISNGMNPGMAGGLMKHYAHLLYELSVQTAAKPAHEPEQTITPVQVNPVTPVQETTLPADKTVEDESAASPVLDKQTPKQVNTSPADEADEDDLTVNEKISRTKQPVMNYAEKSNETPIQDLTKSISIGKKFEFINGLFNGNADAYKDCLANLQKQQSFQNAENYLEENVFTHYNWEENEKLAGEFFALLRRRFMK